MAINWPLILFLWLNAALVVWLVAHFSNKANVAGESAKQLAEHFKTAYADATKQHETQTATLIHQFDKLLAHGAAMHQGQAHTSNRAIIDLAENQTKHVDRVLRTFAAATANRDTNGNGRQLVIPDAEFPWPEGMSDEGRRPLVGQEETIPATRV